MSIFNTSYWSDVGLGACIGTILIKAFTAYTVQYSTGQIAELDPPHVFYDANDWNWNVDYCNPNSVKRANWKQNKPTSMVFFY